MMHLLVLHELHRMRASRQPEIVSIVPEKTVLLEKHGSLREGRFDFLVQTKDKTIGIEVMTRPSQGKLRSKLPYANQVDEFIFVLPHDALAFYRRKKLNGFKRLVPKKFLDSKFADKKLRVWLLDCKQGEVVEKGTFRRIFDVE